MGGIFSLEARDMDTKLLSASESNNTLSNVGWAKEFHQDRASSVKVPVANFTLADLRTGCNRKTLSSVPLKTRGISQQPSVPVEIDSLVTSRAVANTVNNLVS
ncbi:hypothetical protein Tco_0066119 [Tanacetum coccineum]